MWMSHMNNKPKCTGIKELQFKEHNRLAQLIPEALLSRMCITVK